MAVTTVAERPNVLVILCDELRIDLLRCYGGNLVRTPNIDALAADGVVFERAYTPTAVCSPARASLMTGVYAHTHHMFMNTTSGYSYSQHLRPGLTTLDGWLADETRHETAYFGKWHVGPADDLFRSRFEHTQRPYPGGPPFLTSSHWHPRTELGPLVRSIWDGRAGTLDVPMEGFPDVVVARYAQRFLKERDTARPFTLFCSFPGPHLPWLVPEEFGIRYDPRAIPMWPNRNDTFEGKPINQKKLRLLDAEQRRPAQDDATLQEMLACCFSYLELIDGMIGEVVATLKDLGLYETTAIMLSADHGDMAGSHGILSIGSYMYDEVYRIPLLLKPPAGVEIGPQSKRVTEPVHLMDVTATVMHLAAGSPQATMGEQALHGQSLLPLVTGEANGEKWGRAVHYAEYHADWYGCYSSRMVTDGRWKLVWNLSDLCELYDLDGDPYELHNRFYDATCREVRDQYAATLMAEARRLGDGQVLMQSMAVEDRLGAAVFEGEPINR
ncbi:MAG: sulfatase-like hydrolase/transferase [Chloroflexota bacterium]